LKLLAAKTFIFVSNVVTLYIYKIVKFCKTFYFTCNRLLMLAFSYCGVKNLTFSDKLRDSTQHPTHTTHLKRT